MRRLTGDDIRRGAIALHEVRRQHDRGPLFKDLTPAQRVRLYGEVIAVLVAVWGADPPLRPVEDVE
jgi:hypothetical protein